jgi:hypothetical protein
MMPLTYVRAITRHAAPSCGICIGYAGVTTMISENLLLLATLWQNGHLLIFAAIAAIFGMGVGMSARRIPPLIPPNSLANVRALEKRRGCLGGRNSGFTMKSMRVFCCGFAVLSTRLAEIALAGCALQAVVRSPDPIHHRGDGFATMPPVFAKPSGRAK